MPPWILSRCAVKTHNRPCRLWASCLRNIWRVISDRLISRSLPFPSSPQSHPPQLCCDLNQFVIGLISRPPFSCLLAGLTVMSTLVSEGRDGDNMNTLKRQFEVSGGLSLSLYHGDCRAPYGYSEIFLFEIVSFFFTLTEYRWESSVLCSSSERKLHLFRGNCSRR